jgi:hypothetical protein
VSEVETEVVIALDGSSAMELLTRNNMYPETNSAIARTGKNKVDVARTK